MRAELVAFGRIEVDGRSYEHDVVIDGGHVRKRRKGPSKAQRDVYGHTPLTAAESLPWGGRRLIIGTGHDGSLPIAPDVQAEADRRGVELVAVPTHDACQLLEPLAPEEVQAVLHVTC